MIHANYYIAYPKWPCVSHKTNMYSICYMILSFPKPFCILLYVPWLVTITVTKPSCVTDVCDRMTVVTLILALSSINRKWKWKWKETKSTVLNFDTYSKWLYIYFKVNMYCIYYYNIILSEPSISSYHIIWLCDNMTITVS